MNRNIKFFFLMVLAMLIWGGSWVCAKAISHNLHYQQLSFIRFVLTFLFFIPPIFIFKEKLAIGRVTILKIFIGSIFYTLYSQMFFLGLSRGSAGIGGVLVTSLVPVFTFAFMSIETRKKMGLRDAAGLVMGLCGSLVILNVWKINLDGLFISGNIFFIIGSVLWAGVTINSQKTQSRISVWVYSFYLNGFAVVLQAFFTVWQGVYAGVPADFSFWAFMVYLALFSTVFATSVYFYAARHIGSHKASAFSFLVPLSAVFLSWIFLNDVPAASTLFGGIFSIAAIYLIQFSTPPDDLAVPAE